MKPKVLNKLATVLVVNQIVIGMFILIHYFPQIGYKLALIPISTPSDILKFLTYSFVHFSPGHIISNLISFNIMCIFLIFNRDRWYHLIGVILFSSIFAAIGHLFFSIRGAFGAVGFSGCVFGIYTYTVLSYRKSCIIQLFLLILVTLNIALNYRMICNPFHNIGVDIHIWGAASGVLYCTLKGILSELYLKIKNFL